MAEKKKEYCYQCDRSQYSLYPNTPGGQLCLYCHYKQQYLPKDSKIGDCEGFADIVVTKEWREIQSLRGTLE